jgi:ubiquinone/menaquinone biosynthesis C-methylase UbiE
MLKLAHPEKILDVGCGEGVTLDKIQKMKIGKKLEGVDNFDDAITIGTKTFPNLSLKKADIYNLPYKDNSFDMVLCNEVLEHLERPQDALDELRRVSSKYLLLSVPHEPWFQLANFFRGRHVTRFGNHPEHIQHWTKNEFIKMIKKHKLKVRDVKLPFAWTLVLVQKR